MGYALRKDLSNSATIAALQMALANRVYHQPLIHHSHRGLQYCSGAYVSILQTHQIQISMTQNGDPYENAVAERVNGILKEEFYLGEQFIDYDHALTPIQDSIRIYNQQRPHVSCQMLTPQQAHQGQPRQMKKWKKNIKKALA
jgi:transposase InsO family protein